MKIQRHKVLALFIWILLNTWFCCILPRKSIISFIHRFILKRILESYSLCKKSGLQKRFASTVLNKGLYPLSFILIILCFFYFHYKHKKACSILVLIQYNLFYNLVTSVDIYDRLNVIYWKTLIKGCHF